MRKFKISLLVALLAVSGIVTAQENRFSIKGGITASNFTGDDLNDKSAKIGFNVGLGADFGITPNVSIQSGLYLLSKGAEFKAGTESVNLKRKVNALYLQVPVHAALKFDVAPDTKVVLHAGPYAAYGIGGKTKLEGNIGSTSLKLTEYDTFAKVESNNYVGLGYKRFDAGLGIGFGAEFGQFLVDLGWDMGLINISQWNNGKVKNQTGYLSVGYVF